MKTIKTLKDYKELVKAGERGQCLLGDLINIRSKKGFRLNFKNKYILFKVSDKNIFCAWNEVSTQTYSGYSYGNIYDALDAFIRAARGNTSITISVCTD